MIPDKLLELHRKYLNELQETQKRYLFSQINWDDRLNVIVGMRGVGKTTMILQYLKERFGQSEEVLYLSADNILVSTFGLFNLAWEFEKTGGKVLAIDEVHKYKNWSQEIKNIYDSFPRLQIIISGSSSLDIIKGHHDLSRRATPYKLKGLSFREFINFQIGQEVFKPWDFSHLLQNHPRIAAKVVDQLAKNDLKVLKLFRDYLKRGYYPYFLHAPEAYLIKLSNAIAKVVSEDIPATFDINRTGLVYMQKMVFLVATSSPFSPNIAGLASDLGIAKESVYLYLDYLQKASIFNFLYRGGKGAKIARKPEKIYLENSNFFYALADDAKLDVFIGAIREAFVLSQIKDLLPISAPAYHDFLIANRYLLEIGGQSKQVKENGHLPVFIAKDGIEYGFDKTIPLWLLGFLY